MKRRRVALAVTEGAPIFEVAIPCEVFGRPRTDLADPWYDLRICAERPGKTCTGACFVTETPYGFEEFASADTIIVPSCADLTHPGPPALLDALRRAHERGARIVSLCSGVFTLAEAGLLDGRKATVHWVHAALLAERYPRIDVDPAVLYVDGGDVLTSAGVAAGIDLCIHLVRLDLGAEIANRLARRLVVSPHRAGGQAQYVQSPVPESDDESLAPLLDWVILHLDRPLTIGDLARRQRLSPRTFIRRFRAATGTPPLRWLLAQRVRKACALLESTSAPPSRVAELCGLGSEANLRHQFSKVMGIAPVEYRRAFKRQSSATARARAS